MTLKIRDDRQMRALTGLSEEKVNELEKVFTEVYEEEVAAGTRQRKQGGGRKGSLPKIGDKLILAQYGFQGDRFLTNQAEKYSLG